ncbi:A/G-specific adenine glycosylase [Blattabacterium cuenoti]|uniref:A/G-specific adenine glycosylase n=1 Tax=Blattabacterium cuenoti TaxID=1653831 RepID=UPI00163BA932|nr:A/G-specific adenine glycosylase [Blattabacterium cuenoti]
MNFSKKIINWYKKNGRKLPWRNTNDPYYILVSEFMLQQTKISQVLKYYLKFINKFSSINDLAKSKEEEVLKEWEGLGYYSRARNLLNFAKNIVNIGFPNKYEDLIKYKGIGSYIAGAVSSICFNEIVPAIDGNAYRFFSRYLGIYKNAYFFKSKKFTKLVINIMDHNYPGIFNQAVMDIGSTLCTPRKYKCSLCPVSNNCFSKKNNKIYQLPLKMNKMIKNKSCKFFYYFFINFQKKFFIKKRSIDNNIWKNLYDFPGIESNKYLNFNDKISININDISIKIHGDFFEKKYNISNKIIFVKIYNCEIFKHNTESIFHKKNILISSKEIIKYPFPKPILFFFKYKKII